MQAKLLGFMGVDFTNTNGEKVKGTNIYLGFKDANVTGMKAQKFFVKEDIKFPEQIKVNDVLEIGFDYRGKVESITKA